MRRHTTTYTAPEYHFYMRDHLGNNRVDVAADGRICQVTDYYPYGLPMASSRNAASQRWLFGGKELDRISGLDLYDFEARAYDPALARFTSHDILSEFAPDYTSYRYCFNNPLRFSDLFGLFETEEAATAYMSENKINGEVVPSGWGTFLIVDRKRGICYEAGDDTDISSDSHPNDQVVESAYTEGFKSLEKKEAKHDYSIDFASVYLGAADYWYSKLPTSVKSKRAYTNTKTWRKLGSQLPSNSTIYREIIPKTLKWGGKVTGVLSIAPTALEIFNSQTIKASTSFELTMGILSIIPKGGWIIGGTYLAGELTTMLITDKSIGEHLDIYVEEKYGKKGGVLLKW